MFGTSGYCTSKYNVDCSNSTPLIISSPQHSPFLPLFGPTHPFWLQSSTKPSPPILTLLSFFPPASESSHYPQTSINSAFRNPFSFATFLGNQLLACLM